MLCRHGGMCGGSSRFPVLPRVQGGLASLHRHAQNDQRAARAELACASGIGPCGGERDGRLAMEGAMIVKEVMSSHVQWTAPEIPISEIARIMRDQGIGCVPVGENDRLVGMITDRDITCRAVAAGEDLRNVTARDVMSKGIFYCFEDEPIEKAAGVCGKGKSIICPF